ncbi:phage head morphogenesis protein [Burkholderia glumae]|uniref:phage head morphogenesis protein n=1 Tax=Burkholderia glumae TaxID=337 RepID=UPI003D806E3C
MHSALSLYGRLLAADCRERRLASVPGNRAVLDNRTRPQHRAWSGTLLPVTLGFWRTHYPPYGWNCRCTVRPYSEAEMKAAGKQVLGNPDARYRLVTHADE